MIISIVFVLCALFIAVFFLVQSKHYKKNKRLLLSIYLVIFGLACLGVGAYAPGWFKSIPDNIFSINFLALEDSFWWWAAASSTRTYQSFFTKKVGLQKKTNVILVFAESLSPIDSLRVGKTNNNVPYFDLIQKQGITFTNMVNNWCTSDTAHIGLLLWIEPLKLIWSQVQAYTWYTSYTEPLPIFFSKQWYTPIFVSAVDLWFLDQRDFLSQAGFTTIIGEEAFATKKKYVFDAAPDMDLYTKTLETISQQKQPYFLALQTISSHKPYETPYGNSQADAIKYSDKSLYYFYVQLKKAGYFDNGILVIVSDHRKMEPLEKWEKEALGDLWYTRGVATIVGKDIVPGTINTNIIQQTDFFYGLKQHFGKWLITVSKLFNDVFSSNKKRDRWVTYCHYFQNNNKYSIYGWSTPKIFNDLSDIISTHPFIHQYLSSYVSYEQWSWWVVLSGKSDMVVIAHQWSPLQTPENSLEGFLLAKKHGALGIEFDVSQTKDKQNIVIHGDRMRATVCGKKYVVGQHTLAELQKKCPLKNGEPLRTLEEMLTSLKWLFTYYFVEIKVWNQKDAVQQTIDAITTVQKLWMQDKVIFTSYNKEATYVLWSYKNITAGRDTFTLTELDFLPNMNHQYYLMPQDLIKDTTPKEAQDIRKNLVVYTINTTGELENLYNEWVRMVMTDNVPLIKGWADEHLNK